MNLANLDRGTGKIEMGLRRARQICIQNVIVAIGIGAGEVIECSANIIIMKSFTWQSRWFFSIEAPKN